MNNIEKIFIDLDDEITFIIERIRTSDKKRVLVIVPDRATLISSIVSLKLLKRYCTKVNKELMIVTTDELGLSLSSKAGIVTVFRVSDIDEALWERAEIKLKQDKEDLENRKNQNSTNKAAKKDDVNSEEVKSELVVEEEKVAEDVNMDAKEEFDETAKEDLEDDKDNLAKVVVAGAIVNELDQKEEEVNEEGLDVDGTKVLAADDKLNLASKEKIENKDEVLEDKKIKEEALINEQAVEDEKSKDKLDAKSEVAEEESSGIEEIPENRIRTVKGFTFLPGGDIAHVRKDIRPVVTKPLINKSKLETGEAIDTAAVVGISIKENEKNKDSLKSNSATKNNEKNDVELKSLDKAQVDSSKRYKSTRSSFVVGRDVTGVEFKGDKKRGFAAIGSRFRLGNKSTSLDKTSRTNKVPKFHIPKFNYKIAIIIGVVVLFLFAYVYMFAPKAEVKLSVGSKNITASKDVFAKPSINAVDLQALSIPAKATEVIVSSSKTANATGKKQTGENAKGTVTLFNKTSADIKLPAGQNIVAGDKTFTTEAEVTIPKKDESLGTYGTKDVAVRAATFGAAYNLAEGTDFSIAGYNRADQLLGRNFKSFVGGTSVEKLVVSQDDFNKAKDELTAELKPRAVTEVKSKLGSERFFLEDQIKFEVSDATSDPVVSAEAQTFDISVTAKATVTSFANEDLNLMAKDLLKSLVPEGFSIKDDSIKTTSKFVRMEGDALVVNLALETVTLKNLNTSDVVNSIKGKGNKGARKILGENKAITSYEITITPKWLIGLFKHLPRSAEKIKVSIDYAPIEENKGT